MDRETSDYLKRWGHLPFCEDIQGFRERVKIMEKKFCKEDGK